jgi:DNA mismatch repair ATPase MutL
MAASIRQLSKRTASAIQAGVVVPKLDRIIIELVQNSLDAQSTGIDITLQHDNTSLTIADNGHGITFADLKTVGSAACSSKQNPLQSSQPTFGFRGQALHSIQAYAVLTIESRDPKTLRCYRKCLYEGATLSFEPMDHRIIGTRITLSNIYGNFPVRHRQLAQFKLPPTLIALANLLFAQKRGKVTMIAKGDAIYRTVLEYHSDLQFMCAQLEDATWRAHLFPVDGMHPVFKIGGIIANQGHTTASHQYIAVNGRPIHSSFVHDHVRQQFQKSLLGRVSEYQGM